MIVTHQNAAKKLCFSMIEFTRANKASPNERECFPLTSAKIDIVCKDKVCFDKENSQCYDFTEAKAKAIPSILSSKEGETLVFDNQCLQVIKSESALLIKSHISSNHQIQILNGDKYLAIASKIWNSYPTIIFSEKAQFSINVKGLNLLNWKTFPLYSKTSDENVEKLLFVKNPLLARASQVIIQTDRLTTIAFKSGEKEIFSRDDSLSEIEDLVIFDKKESKNYFPTHEYFSKAGKT